MLAKKQYSQPVIYAERFALAEHISSCLYTANLGNGCPIAEADITFFNTSCGTEVAGMWEFAGVNPDLAKLEDLSKLNVQCYNSFRDLNTLFTS